MFKRDENAYNLPLVTDLQAIARVPSQVWSLAKLALIVWAAVWVAGALVRLFTTLHIFRLNKDNSGDKVSVQAVRPVYALFNFNIGCKKSNTTESEE